MYIYVYIYMYAKLFSTQTRRVPHRLWDISQQILDYIRLLQTANMGTVFEPPREFGQVQVFVIFRGKPVNHLVLWVSIFQPWNQLMMSCHPYFKAIYHSGGTLLISFNSPSLDCVPDGKMGLQPIPTSYVLDRNGSYRR